MCVAIPGLVKRLKDGKVTVDFNGNEVEAYAGLVSVKEGYVVALFLVIVAD